VPPSLQPSAIAIASAAPAGPPTEEPSLAPVLRLVGSPTSAGAPDVSDADETRSGARGPEREEARRRTAELMSRIADATPDEWRQIRDEVVTLHLWLAASAVRRFGFRGEYDDLLQVARSGLVEAFDRYDPAQTSYAYFAWVTMNGLLRRHLRDHGWSIRPPRPLQEAANLLRRETPELTQRLGRTPTAADLAEHLSWSVPDVHGARAAQLGMSSASLDALTDERRIAEGHGDWDRVEASVVLHGVLGRLTDDERELIRLRFVEELTQDQIGQRLGVNQMRISRQLTRLMAKLRGLIGELDEPAA
jgi:RNA polymerase sigma-B factor